MSIFNFWSSFGSDFGSDFRSDFGSKSSQILWLDFGGFFKLSKLEIPINKLQFATIVGIEHNVHCQVGNIKTFILLSEKNKSDESQFVNQPPLIAN